MNGRFEKGNSAAAAKGEFKQAIKRALAAENGKRLRDAAEKLLDLAACGERWACEMLRDTLDGKPAQQIVATDDEGRSVAIALIQYAPKVVGGQQEGVLPSLPGFESPESSRLQ